MVVSWCVIDWTPEGSESYPGGVVLRDSAGTVIRVSLGPGDVDCRPYYRADHEDWIVKALVASEDGTFWTHCGVRPLSMVRAFCQNVFYRRRISGASTLTMQAVRLIRPHRKGYAQKWVESFQAMKMERRRDKLWILSQYLNRAPFGSNFIGIEAAANGWFGKGPKELGLGEAALLAGMVQAPSRFRPDRGYAAAIKRRDYVLSRMLELGYVTAEQVAGAREVRPELCRAPRPFDHPYYCDYYLQSVLKRDREAQHRSGDFTTPLDADIQALCEGAVKGATDGEGPACAVLVMKVETGDVVALACSGDYFDRKEGQVNTALTPRPAGSTLKPFLSAQTIDLGLVTPSTELADVPMSFKGYRPANFDGKYRGRVSLRDALILSLNIPFVSLVKQVGVERFGAKLRELGFTHLRESDDTYGLGMAIGNVEVSLLELVRAYRNLACAEAFSRGSSYLVADMLSGTERSGAALGHVMDVATSRFAWKTGTSSAYRDAWTVAWNPDYVVGVWRGHLSGNFGDTSVVGARAAAPIAWQIARALYPRQDGPWFVEPQDDAVLRLVRQREAHPGSVKLAAPRLSLLKPEDGARFVCVPGMRQQQIVCQATGNGAKETLWWFVDGLAKGETVGTDPFVLDMETGDHIISCANAEGDSAEAKVSVE